MSRCRKSLAAGAAGLVAGWAAAPLLVRPSSGLLSVAARLPVPFLLGLRLAVRRPRRSILAMTSLAITVAMVVAAIAMHGDIARKDARTAGLDFVPGAPNPVTEQVGQVMFVLMLALLVLAAVNAVVIAWAASVDALRSTGLARALGATPWQVTAGLSAAQLFPATGAALAASPWACWSTPRPVWRAALRAGP